jgi:hypothetical protein
MSSRFSSLKYTLEEIALGISSKSAKWTRRQLARLDRRRSKMEIKKEAEE